MTITPRRMFDYFALIHRKFGLPVYPIAVFSFDRPVAAVPTEYRVNAFDFDPLHFQFRSVQLNRMEQS
jgi:hypothetical protein